MRGNQAVLRKENSTLLLNEINIIESLCKETWEMTESEGESRNKGFRLLGILDVKNTPCARDALLNGAGGSLAIGLLHFLTTSRVRRSFDVGFAGFMLTTLGSWFYCRINNAKLRVQQRMIQDGIKNKIVYEGTVLDPTKKPQEEKPSNAS